MAQHAPLAPRMAQWQGLTVLASTIGRLSSDHQANLVEITHGFALAASAEAAVYIRTGPNGAGSIGALWAPPGAACSGVAESVIHARIQRLMTPGRLSRPTRLSEAGSRTLIVPVQHSSELSGYLIAWRNERPDETATAAARAFAALLCREEAAYRNQLELREARARLDEVTAVMERERAEQAGEERFRRLAENARDIIYRTNLGDEARTEYMNPAVTAILGYAPEDFYGDPGLPERLVHPDDRAARQRSRREPTSDTLVIRWRHRDGHWVWIEHKPILVRDEAGRVVAVEGIGRDITDRIGMEENIRYLSYYDRLTGLLNRARFEESLADHQRLGTSPLSVIMGDLNGLKVVNDAFGHQEGDRLLARAAALLNGSLPDQALLCRWGGDEFAILLPGLEEQAAAVVSGAIRQTFAKAPEDPIRPSIALGVATRQDMSKSASDLLGEAEDRMYRNKLVETRSAHSTALASLQRTLAERTHETDEHARRLSGLCLRVGLTLGLPEAEMADLSLLAILHDIGKVAIPDAILNNPGPLSVEQWEIMQRHTEIGYRITSSCPDLAHIAPAVLSHHERWDGDGYPQGLAGQAIPRIARILAIADAYDVMINGRPYRGPVDPQAAVAELERCAGSQFDPQLVPVFRSVLTGR